MGEYVDFHDEFKNITNETYLEKKGEKAISPQDRYTIVVLAIIENDNKEILVQKTSSRKKGIWALTGGHVKSGETSIQGIQEELHEEMNILVNSKEITLFKTYKYDNAFKDVYYIKKNINLSDITLQKDEVEKVEYLSKELGVGLSTTFSFE